MQTGWLMSSGLNDHKLQSATHKSAQIQLVSSHLSCANYFHIFIVIIINAFKPTHTAVLNTVYFLCFSDSCGTKLY